MMYSKLLLFFVVLFSSTITLAQVPLKFRRKKKPPELEWQIAPAVGIYLPITKLLKNQTADYLIGYDNHTHYYQFLAGNLFIGKHWGIAFNLRASTSSNISKRKGRFIQGVIDEYDDRYYADPATSANSNQGDFLSGTVMRGHLGVIYRVQAGRFFVHPQLAIGITSWYTSYGIAYLKEKGTNQYAMLSYQDREIPSDHFTPAASVAAGYRINKWLAVHAEVMGSWFKTNIVFDKVVRDLNSKDILSREAFPYRENIFTISTGAGLLFSIRGD